MYRALVKICYNSDNIKQLTMIIQIFAKMLRKS